MTYDETGTRRGDREERVTRCHSLGDCRARGVLTLYRCVVAFQQ